MKLSFQTRLGILFTAFVAGLLVIAGKLVYVQLIKGEALQHLAAGRQTSLAASQPRRGEILDHNGEVLAISLPAVSLYAHPHRVTEPVRAKGCELLRRANLTERCAQLDGAGKFAWIARDVPRQRLEQILGPWRKLTGLGLFQGSVRTYPKGSLAGQLLGFVGVDGQGLEGIERAMDEQLRPESKQMSVVRDARRKLLLGPEEVAALSTRQRNVALTIDASIQSLVEDALAWSLEDSGGSTAIALVAEAETGAIRAAAVAPPFNPNEFQSYGPKDWRPRFATDAFEPGSTVKPLLLSAALSNDYSLHEIIYAENGRFLVDDHEITDTDPHGWLSLRNVVVKSSNIGAAKVGFMIGKDALYNAYRSFGFGQRVGLDLPSETKGIFRTVDRWSKLDWATLSFGQGLSVSPLQLLQAYLVVANDGRRVKPQLVERVFDAESGRTEWQPDNEAAPAMARGEVLESVRYVLGSVVEEGTGQQARVPGLTIGGKTGTAQKPDLVDGGYREGAYIAWFVGMFPLDDPKWVAVVLVDEPSTSIYGGAVAAPVFQKIAESVAIREGLLDGAGAGDAPRLPRAPGRTEQVAAVGTVPDLTGLSLREAAMLAGASQAKILAAGSGRIVAQQPAAGTAFQPPATWTVELQPAEAS